MSKRISFVGFLTIALLIALSALACSKKPDENKPAAPAESNTPADSNSHVPKVSSLTEEKAIQAEADSNKLKTDSNKTELTEDKAGKETDSGFITAIAYSDRSSVLIGKELLHEGDTIQGAKVAKIGEGTVDFEKNSKRWTQKTGETLSSFWAEPNQH